MHYYENFEVSILFPIVYQPEEMLAGLARVRGLASDPRLIISGHDPEVMKRFAADQTVRLWIPN
jgi:hypothetical protein